jgi:hypothetical protein
MSTSYDNLGGKGDRTALITVTATKGITYVSPGNITYFVNGNTTESKVYLSNQAVAGLYIRFDFGVGASKIIDEATWYQSVSSTHGVWQWQGSSDAASWTDIGATFTLGGTVQVQTSLSGNLSGYRYYQMIGVSGNAVNTPWTREIEFKIDNLPTVLTMPLFQLAI